VVANMYQPVATLPTAPMTTSTGPAPESPGSSPRPTTRSAMKTAQTISTVRPGRRILTVLLAVVGAVRLPTSL
jgi:hypothetical protein